MAGIGTVPLSSSAVARRVLSGKSTLSERARRHAIEVVVLGWTRKDEAEELTHELAKSNVVEEYEHKIAK